MQRKNILHTNRKRAGLHFHAIPLDPIRLYLASFLGFKTLLEFVYASAGVNEFLFAGEERMAFGANFNLEITLCGLSLDNFAASASNGCVNVVRMDSCFHYLHLTFR